jgi:teichuronic acid biosynthesis glycosyltransferase TuaG
MTIDLVSIVMPAFNAQAYLGETMESVLAQSRAEWELIVVDDCSTDGTYEIAAAYGARDTRIRVVRLERSSGPAMARNAAIEAASGRYVAFLDSDDLWLPQKLERQLDFMRRRGAALGFTAYRRISADGARVGRMIHVPPRLDYRALLGNTAIATSTAIVDRARVGPIRMVKTYYDDFALWLEITRRGFYAVGLDEDLMRYRVVAGSVSRNKGRSAMMVWRTYREVERLGLIQSSWAFARYAANALRKYAVF